jgi:hypothetical protein
LLTKPRIEDRRHLEHAGEVNWDCQLLGSHGANAIGGAQEICFVPIDKVGDVPGFLFEAGGHIKFVIGDFVERLRVAGGEVPGKLPSSA